ncbi:MAG: hypothetical protein V9F03_13685 [Microthrixaceae bacterium]
MQKLGKLAPAVLVVAVVMTVSSACGGSGDKSTAKVTRKSDKQSTATTTGGSEGQGDPIEDQQSASGPTTDLVLVSDPVNNAFSVQVPLGWDNLVYSTVEGQIHNEIVNSMSPDGETVLFIGDPKIPSYWDPDQANEITRQFTENLDSMDLAYYSPAPEYFSKYVTDKFGQLDGFQVTGSELDSTVVQRYQDAFAARGLQVPQIDAVVIRFTFSDDAGKTTNALLKGVTINSGPVWQASAMGIGTTGNPDDFLAMLQQVFDSKKTNPDFTASQNQRHEQIMAQIQANTEAMTRRHEANMAQIQASANAHQQRMQAMWSANDASVSNFYQRMNSGDVQQRGFLNYINEENTVQTSGGQKMQVDNSYQRYWVNKSDGSYVGGDINFGDSQLRGMGLNPSDYEEAQIVKG